MKLVPCCLLLLNQAVPLALSHAESPKRAVPDSSERFLFFTEQLSQKQKSQEKLNVDVAKAWWYAQTTAVFEVYLRALGEVQEVMSRDTSSLKSESKVFEDGEACYRVATLDAGIDKMRELNLMQDQVSQTDQVEKKMRATDRELTLLKKVIQLSAPVSGYCGVTSRVSRHQILPNITAYVPDPRLPRGDHKTFVNALRDTQKATEELLNDLRPASEELERTLDQDIRDEIQRQQEELRYQEIKQV